MFCDDWEDYQAGMYAPTVDPDGVGEAAALLRDSDQFREAAAEMIRNWSVSAEHNLAFLPTGHHAWLGQATCCYVLGVTAATTRAAWGMLANGEQRTANAVARSVIDRWERESQSAQALFDY